MEFSAPQTTLVPTFDVHQPITSNWAAGDGEPKALLKAIKTALAAKRDGVLVVRSGSHTGQIFVHNGAIAWINSSMLQGTLTQALVIQAEIDRSILADVVSQCAKSKKNLAETLMLKCGIPAEKLRSCLLSHNARHFREVCTLEEPFEIRFKPHQKRYADPLLFTLDEVLSVSRSINKSAADLELVGVNQDAVRSVRNGIPDCDSVLFCVADPTTSLPLRTLFSSKSGQTRAPKTKALCWLRENSIQEVRDTYLQMHNHGTGLTAFAEEMILLSEDSALILFHNSTPEFLMAASCVNPSNIGLTLSMARMGFHELGRRVMKEI